MRAGRLNTLVLVTPTNSPPYSAWVEWLASVPTNTEANNSLIQPETITLRHRNLPPLLPGDWVDYDGRRLRVGFTGKSKKVRNAFESICSEYAGQPATYTPTSGSPLDVQVFIERNLDYIGEVGRVAETRHRIEILQQELNGHEPAGGDWVTLNGQHFTVEGIAPGIDDGILFNLVCT